MVGALTKMITVDNVTKGQTQEESSKFVPEFREKEESRTTPKSGTDPSEKRITI